MEPKSYEAAKESLEFLIRTGDWQLVGMAKNSRLLGLTRKMFFETTLEQYHEEWSKTEVRIVYWTIERVLDITFDIYLFREHPIHLLEYIEGRLRWHPVEFRQDLIEMLNYCINDAKRFPKSKVNIEYIKQQLKGLKSAELSEGIILDSKQAFSFFGVEEISMDEFLAALIHSNGYAKSEKEEIDELRRRYFELTGGNILPPQPIETKTDKFKSELDKYGFFELPKVKQLSEPNKQSLIELISSNPMPYGIAMFDFLGFLNHLTARHFTTGTKLFKEVAKWFEVADRSVKGNIGVLNEVSGEDRRRYTADQHKQTVQKDYQKLK